MISIFRDELPDAVYREIAKEQVLLALPDTHPQSSMHTRLREMIFCIWNMQYLNRETFIVPTQSQSMRRTANHIFEQVRIRRGA